MKALWVACLILLTAVVPARADVPSHAGWTALLQRYVTVGGDAVNRVDYAAWKASTADRRQLAGYIAALEAAKPSEWSADDRFAYWANLYNAVTVSVVLDRYPVRSIRDIKSEGVGFDLKAAIGPWRTKRVTVEGKRLSLDDIEHGILRPEFSDPRVHYAVNCASIGCPNLQREAFVGARLNAQLDAAAADFINHSRGVAVTDRGLQLSSIYKWFAVDFGSEAQLKTHLARYAAPSKAAAIRAAGRIAGYDYDWAINDVRATR